MNVFRLYPLFIAAKNIKPIVANRIYYLFVTEINCFAICQMQSELSN